MTARVAVWRAYSCPICNAGKYQACTSLNEPKRLLRTPHTARKRLAWETIRETILGRRPHSHDIELEAYTADRVARHVRDGKPDSWKLQHWNSLPDICLIEGCDGSEIDQRGPVWVRNGDHVLMLKACVEHWEAVYRVLGVQASWERMDGSWRSM